MDNHAMAVAAAAPGVAGLARRSSRIRKQIEPVFVQCALSQFQVKGFRAGFWIFTRFGYCRLLVAESLSGLGWVGRERDLVSWKRRICGIY